MTFKEQMPMTFNDGLVLKLKLTFEPLNTSPAIMTFKEQMPKTFNDASIYQKIAITNHPNCFQLLNYLNLLLHT